MLKLNNKIKNKKGFTLVELLVVLAVLAIISAIAIPRFAGVQDSAKKKADAESINMVMNSLQLCVEAEGFSTDEATSVVIANFTDGKFTVATATAPTNFSTKLELYLKIDPQITLNDKTIDKTFTLLKNGTVTVKDTTTP